MARQLKLLCTLTKDMVWLLARARNYAGPDKNEVIGDYVIQYRGNSATIIEIDSTQLMRDRNDGLVQTFDLRRREYVYGYARVAGNGDSVLLSPRYSSEPLAARTTSTKAYLHSLLTNYSRYAVYYILSLWLSGDEPLEELGAYGVRSGLAGIGDFVLNDNGRLYKGRLVDIELDGNDVIMLVQGSSRLYYEPHLHVLDGYNNPKTYLPDPYFPEEAYGSAATYKRVVYVDVIPAEIQISVVSASQSSLTVTLSYRGLVSKQLSAVKGPDGWVFSTVYMNDFTFLSTVRPIRGISVSDTGVVTFQDLAKLALLSSCYYPLTGASASSELYTWGCFSSVRYSYTDFATPSYNTPAVEVTAIPTYLTSAPQLGVNNYAQQYAGTRIGPYSNLNYSVSQFTTTATNYSGSTTESTTTMSNSVSASMSGSKHLVDFSGVHTYYNSFGIVKQVAKRTSYSTTYSYHVSGSPWFRDGSLSLITSINRYNLRNSVMYRDAFRKTRVVAQVTMTGGGTDDSSSLSYTLGEAGAWYLDDVPATPDSSVAGMVVSAYPDSGAWGLPSAPFGYSSMRYTITPTYRNLNTLLTFPEEGLFIGGYGIYDANTDSVLMAPQRLTAVDPWTSPSGGGEEFNAAYLYMTTQAGSTTSFDGSVDSYTIHNTSGDYTNIAYSYGSLEAEVYPVDYCDPSSGNLGVFYIPYKDKLRVGVYLVVGLSGMYSELYTTLYHGGDEGGEAGNVAGALSAAMDAWIYNLNLPEFQLTPEGEPAQLSPAINWPDTNRMRAEQLVYATQVQTALSAWNLVPDPEVNKTPDQILEELIVFCRQYKIKLYGDVDLSDGMLDLMWNSNFTISIYPRF